MLKKIIIILTLMFIPNLLLAGDTDNYSYEDIAWLAGKWEGEAFGGICHEIWETEAGGTMTGTFKLINNGKISFYELMVIDLNLEKPALILKHFNADMTGWEEKDKVITFPLVSISKDELKFDGLIYKKIDEDNLQILVVLKGEDGKTNTITIDCKKIE